MPAKAGISLPSDYREEKWDPSVRWDDGAILMTQRKSTQQPAHSGTLSLALDFGPLLVFFLGYKFLGTRPN